MLILTRRVGESVMIGDDVIITVLGVKGNQTRVGITAPKSVPVHREEVFERIQAIKNHGGEELKSVDASTDDYGRTYDADRRAETSSTSDEGTTATEA